MLSNISIDQGDVFVTRDRGVIIRTILGSCVSCCLFDPTTGVVGMNHYVLLRQGLRSSQHIPEGRLGESALPLLLQQMVEFGARPERIEAKVFGGANKVGANTIGERNIAFAFDFLKKNGIPVVSYDVGGNQGRKILFDTSDFIVYVKRLNESPSPSDFPLPAYDKVKYCVLTNVVRSQKEIQTWPQCRKNETLSNSSAA